LSYASNPNRSIQKTISAQACKKPLGRNNRILCETSDTNLYATVCQDFFYFFYTCAS